ncbi:plexin-A4-like [Ptychodera flava]|uniref:plexin-A4-like n=1 Tax=Ptychodera flava TaxID=63121 RepID=UPI003969CD72
MKQNEILVPKDMAREIHLQAQSLPVLKDGYSAYKCILTVEGKDQETEAIRQNETYIICSRRSYTYEAEEQEMIANVTVTWNDNHILDDLYSSNVTLYDCSVDREDCSLCLSSITTRPELQCGWCRDAGAEMCQIQDQCQDWLYQEPQSCDDPKIHNVWPLAGPIEGGTEVQINGSNMGTMFSDIVSVTVADLPCTLIEDKYAVSRSITCITKKCDCGEKSGNVVVTIVHGRTDTSADTYDYRDPVVKDFNPKIGPIAGGTLVTVTGDYMDSGRNINVFIGDSECTVNRGEVNATAIPCRTSEYSQPDSFNVVVNFDGAQREAPTDAEFNYAENPTVTHLSPLESSLSGGRMIEVNGTRFDVPGEARMTIKEGDVVFYSDPCVVKSQGSMECKTPRVEVSSSSRRKRDTDCVEGCDVEVGFQMDGYVTVMPDGFTIFVDPEYFEFEDDDQIASYTSVIQIRGRHLDFAATASEVTVYIGQEYCIVQSLSSVQLNCEPPAESPDGVDKNGTRTENGLPEVRVEVGNLGFYIGYLEYPRNTLSSGVIGGLAGGILGVLVAAAIIIVIFCIRRSSKKSQKLEGMAKMLDDLEMNVQSEAKRAFTELQTEMSDLNSDVEGSIGIPVLDYDDYAVNMMFAGQTDHPVFQKSEVVLKSSTITGLKQFYHLLKKKHFLLIFIETLEAQKGVSPRDRVNIGSLLTVALHSEKKMVYLTDVLKTLLANAAAKAVDRSKEKQMLRRTESVMEKLLTNWFVLTLYDFLKDTAASPIFLLYRALKHQIEKGPVDSVTGLAKYSLTDDLLLTERLDESALNVNIVTTWDGKADVQARLLDVDTVSQSKEKILDVMYKNTRYSKKPLVRDIDLEWRAGRDGHGHLTLQDQDVSSEIEGNWKRLNTLQHYKIPDGSNLALVYKDNAVNVNSNIRTPITVANEYDFVHFHDPDMVPDVVNSANSKAHILSSDEDLNEENEEEQSALKVWHLIKSKNYHTSVYDQQSNKKQKKKKTQPAQKTKRIISELYLTQLITTKHTVQKFVDDAFQTLLKFERQQFPRQFPPAIKYMFDFLDGLAERHDVDDPDITHIWKSNSLPLRMWANILKCPHFVFDVNVNQTLTASLEVISQAFVDSCSKIERKIGKDTPPAKMLYNNDVKVYKPVVDMYYEDIKRQSPISEKEFGIYLEESFVELGGKFDKMSAISELYKYATKYGGDLLDALEESEVCKKENLAFQLEQVAARMAENDYGEVVV